MPSSSWRPAVAVAALLLLIGAVDYGTGLQLRVFPLYFLPLTLLAWRFSRRVAVAGSMLAATTWHVCNVLLEAPIGMPAWIQITNSVTMFIAFAAVSVLVSELRRRLHAERESSRTDALTGLANRRGFLEAAGVLLAASQRAARPVTLAFVDLDLFKRVNDEHGHDAGDAALRSIAEVLRSDTRTGDLVGRLGGDELALLLADCGAEQARGALERIRARAAEAMRARGWPITTSIGAVAFAAGTLSLDDAIRSADALMYEVKQNGRDHVRLSAHEARA